MAGPNCADQMGRLSPLGFTPFVVLLPLLSFSFDLDTPLRLRTVTDNREKHAAVFRPLIDSDIVGAIVTSLRYHKDFRRRFGLSSPLRAD
jgi:hypothetical protein